MQTSYLASLSLTFLTNPPPKKNQKQGRVLGSSEITCQYCANVAAGGEGESISVLAPTHNRDRVTTLCLTQITLEHA